MYNYLGVIRKSTAIDHCISCYFFDTKTPNLILSKNNRIEFYNFTPEGITANKYINIYGKIKILLSIPNNINNNNIIIIKDDLFVLSNDLDFCIFSYSKSNNNIDTSIMGSIKEDLGKIEDNILYSFDSNKNYLLICAYKNIFKIICVNNNMRLNDKYKNYTIRFQYEKILFLSPFYYDKSKIKKEKNKNNEKDNNNLLTFVAIKSDFIELINNDSNNTQIQQKLILETFQIKIDPNSFNPPHFLYKPKVVSNGKMTNININSTRRKLLHNKNNINNNNNKNNNNNIPNSNENNINNLNNNKNNESSSKNNENNTISYNSEKIIESANFLEILNFDDNQNISLMITHSEGLIIIFFSKYVVYYKYNSSNSTLSSSKSINYDKRKFIDYVVADEKNFKYYVIDDNGNIFLFGFLNNKNNNNFNNLNLGITLQILGKLNICSCMAYLNNNILFIGSSKCNSQLIKINENIDNNDKTDNFERIEILEEYESLSPVSNMALINNTKEENGIEILTVSGVGNNCAIKNIKKGTKVLFCGDIEIKNIVKIFKVLINNVGKKNYKTRNNNINYCSFVITTNIKSFIINYDYKYKIVSLNKSIIFQKNELVKFVKNIKNLILIVTNINIYIYKNDSFLTLTTEYSKNKNNIKNNWSPLIIKYNKNLTGLFIYYNNNVLVKYKIDENNGKIIDDEIILTNISISSFDLCKYFLIYSLWDNNQIGIYSFYSKKINYFSGIDDSFNFSYISSIQIIKINEEYSIFLSSSIGKLFYMQLKEKINKNNIKNEFTYQDFIIKRNYNLSLENFKVTKIKKKNQKFLFLDTSLPCFIFFNNNNLIISNFNANYCKDILVLDNEDNNFLFVFNDKISFGSFSNTQNQNIYTLKSGKTINTIKLIDFRENDNNKKLNNYKSMKYILTIEEKISESITQNHNIILSSLVLNDINMKEISKYNFEYENEISMTLAEINILQNDDSGKKYFVIGTGITDYKKEEPTWGHLYLIEININNNFSIKKLQELEVKGGVYKIETYKNIIYVGIKNTLFIYSLIKKNIENFYEFKLIRHCSDFTLINDIYILKQKDKEIENNKNLDKNNEDKNKIVNEIFVCDLYKSIILYKYDITNDKLNEVGRDYNLTWIYSILQCKENLTYITDIDDNIIVLEKINYSKNDKEKIKFNHKSFFNYGERINILVSTEIVNKDLSLLTFQNTDEDSFELYKTLEINSQDNIKITYFGTLEGSIGYIIQLNKETYEFLYILQEVLIRKINNNGGFNYKRWRSFKDGYISIESKGFIEGEIIKEFLNYDDDYKKIIVKEMNYPWKKTINEIVHIIETLNNFY